MTVAPETAGEIEPETVTVSSKVRDVGDTEQLMVAVFGAASPVTENVASALVEAVKVASPGQLDWALHVPGASGVK